jgi:Ca2+-binding RTX toxin-like protein
MGIIKQATSINKVVESLGINTHIDFNRYGYENIDQTIGSINYLGVKNLRDSPNKDNILGANGTWQRVADGTGAKFNAFMNQGSTASDLASLVRAQKLAGQGILNFIEGGNENDSAYSVSLGNSIEWTANFQQQVYATGVMLGIPVINMSFGAGWTAANNWQGNYDKVGDLSAFADYANAHTYPNVGQTTDKTMERLNGLAHLAAPLDPVITTEIGWDNRYHTEADAARYTLQAVFDGIENGNVKTYFYSLYDDGSGKFGLMNADGTAKLTGKALHNLTTIMADTGGAPRSDTLGYNLTGTTAADHTLLFQKSNGVFQMAVWNETEAAHDVTLTLDKTAQTIRIYHPLTGESAVQTVSATGTITFTVPNHPVIVEIVPTGISLSGTPTAPIVVTPLAGMEEVPRTIYAKTDDYVYITGGTNNVYLIGHNGTIAAEAGTNMLYANGTNNVLFGGTGNDKVTAFGGNNMLAGLGGDDTFTFSGSNNTVYVGIGKDTVRDSGTNNLIVFAKPGEGVTDIYGYVLKNGDTLDMRTTLAATSWTKDPAKLADYLKVTMSGANAVVSIDADGTGAGAAQTLAILHASGNVTMSSLLAHSLVA